MEREEVCRERQDKGLRVSDTLIDFDDTLHLARVLGGQMAVADSNKTMQDMITSFGKITSECGDHFNSGYTDREKEGTFVNINTGEPLTWVFWDQGEPNNWGGNEDCTSLKRSGLNDERCENPHCPLLNMTSSPSFQMRGLCPGSAVDVFYTLILTNETLISKAFLGFKQTKLGWSDKLKQWSIVNLADHSILAHSNSTSDYPFGTHPWFFTNNSCTVS